MDTITFEIVRASLYAIAREMKAAMMRTAASPIIHSGGDASAAVFDAAMQLVAQGDDIPTMLGSAVLSTRASVEAIGLEKLRPGDVIVSNDAYLGGGNHQSDVQFTRPVFFDGAIVAYVMTRGHWSDIGGQTPGSHDPATWDIFGEGIRIPPVLLYRNDEAVPDLLGLIVNNTRDPRSRLLDVKAQYAGTYVGEQRLRALAAKYGAATLAAAMARSLDYSEALMRAQIERIPDGVYAASDWIEPVAAPGWSDALIPIQVKVTVSGSDIHFDFDGTGRQVRGGINCPLSVTCNSTWFSVKAIAGRGIPINQGCYRPITIDVPEGTLLNCTHPASVVSGNTDTSPRVIDLLLKALAPAVPERVIAESHAAACVATFSGEDPDELRCRALRRKYVASVEPHAGGMGARPDKDGVNAVRVHVGNTSTMSVELLEHTMPLVVESWSLVTDSGGAGRWRGGCASRRTYRVGFEEATFGMISERGRVAPRGLFGGQPGALYECRVERADGENETIPTKGRTAVVRRGDRVIVQPAGSGGYGDPLERAAGQVRDDVRDGYVSIEAARGLYGVVLTEDDRRVDTEATTALRSQLRSRESTP